MKYIPLIIVIILVALALLGPWTVPYGFQTAARIMPVQSWEMVQYPNGTLLCRWHDNITQGVIDQQMYQFEESDVVNMRFLLDSLDGRWVPASHRVLEIESNSLAEQLVEVQTNLMEQRALLNNDRIGDKPETLDRLKEEVRLAEERIVLLEKQYNRQVQLLKEGLSAVADFEMAENALATGRQALVVAQNRLTEQEAGVKPESIDLINARIAALEVTADFLQNKDDLYSIYSPISGNWRRTYTLDGASHLWVEDTSASVVLVPVRNRDLGLLQDTFQLVLGGEAGDQKFDVNHWEASGPKDVIDNEAVRWVQLQVNGLDDQWRSNVPVACRIELGEYRVIEYLRQTVEINW